MYFIFDFKRFFSLTSFIFFSISFLTLLLQYYFFNFSKFSLNFFKSLDLSLISFFFPSSIIYYFLTNPVSTLTHEISAFLFFGTSLLSPFLFFLLCQSFSFDVFISLFQIWLFGRRQPNLRCLHSPSLLLNTIVSSKTTAFAIFHHHHHRCRLVAPSTGR